MFTHHLDHPAITLLEHEIATLQEERKLQQNTDDLGRLLDIVDNEINLLFLRIIIPFKREEYIQALRNVFLFKRAILIQRLAALTVEMELKPIFENQLLAKKLREERDLLERLIDIILNKALSLQEYRVPFKKLAMSGKKYQSGLRLFFAGFCCEEGLFGEKSMEEAVIFYAASAKKDFAPAFKQLAMLKTQASKEDGLQGLPVNARIEIAFNFSLALFLIFQQGQETQNQTLSAAIRRESFPCYPFQVFLVHPTSLYNYLKCCLNEVNTIFHLKAPVRHTKEIASLLPLAYIFTSLAEHNNFRSWFANHVINYPWGWDLNEVETFFNRRSFIKKYQDHPWPLERSLSLTEFIQAILKDYFKNMHQGVLDEDGLDFFNLTRLPKDLIFIVMDYYFRELEVILARAIFNKVTHDPSFYKKESHFRLFPPLPKMVQALGEKFLGMSGKSPQDFDKKNTSYFSKN